MVEINSKKCEGYSVPKGCTPREYMDKFLVENGIKQLILEYLKKTVHEGLSNRYSRITDSIRQRADRELEKINEYNLIELFIVLRDIVLFTKKENIWLSPGTGTLPGSIASYSLGITDVDPIRYELIFERFVNGNSPAICLETEIGGSRRIEEYFVEEYGNEILDLLNTLDVHIRDSRNVSIIKETLESIERTSGHRVELSDINYNDESVYKLIGSNEIVLASFDERYNTAFLDDQDPRSMEDLCARLSLDRPGLEERAEIYNTNKKDISGIKYETPLLESILRSTYGTIVYQEQIMLILNELAGYPLEHADNLRRDMAKRTLLSFDKHKSEFIAGNKDKGITGCLSNGMDEGTASDIFDTLYDVTRYTFNKSHAAACAITLYRLAWLKCYYEAEYIKALKKDD